LALHAPISPGATLHPEISAILEGELLMRIVLAILGISVVGVAACGGSVVVGSGGAGSSSSQTTSSHAPAVDGGGAACVAACASAHAQGAQTFGYASGGCICLGCSAACTQSVCHDGALPSDACLPCVQAAVAGDTCQNHEGLFDECTKGPNGDCHAFVTCFQACGP
jgi:hypothetical protein